MDGQIRGEGGERALPAVPSKVRRERPFQSEGEKIKGASTAHGSRVASCEGGRKGILAGAGGAKNLRSKENRKPGKGYKDFPN